MSRLPILGHKELIKILLKMGFKSMRISGSHNILKHEDGRSTTIPMHGNEDIS